MRGGNRAAQGLVFACLAAAGCGGGGGGGGQGSGGRLALAPGAISSDGRFVVYEVSRDVDGNRDVVVEDVQTGERTTATSNPVGAPCDGDSYQSSISADGSHVAFTSSATDLVPGMTGGGFHVFRRDLGTGVTEVVDVNTFGEYGDGWSGVPRISDDGRFVVFESVADDLVADDTNGLDDVFVRDMATGITERVNVDSSGVEANDTSGWSVFSLDQFGSPDISGDGRYVVFASLASNLVTGDANGAVDVFVHDRLDGTTIRVSVDSAGGDGPGDSRAPVLTSDGRFVAFLSKSDLAGAGVAGYVEVYRHDLATEETTLLSTFSDGSPAHGDSWWVSLSDDGRYAAFECDAIDLGPGEPFGRSNVFLHDGDTGSTTRLEPSPDRIESTPDLSSDGRFAVYYSWNFDEDVRIYLYDRVTGQSTELADVH